MTDTDQAELTDLRRWHAKAIAFDGGHEVITDGCLFTDPKRDRGFKYHYKLQFNGKGWLVTVGNRVLSAASGVLETFDGRIEDLGAACVYADVRQAQKALEGYIFKETARAMRDKLPIWHRDPARRLPYGEED